MEKNLIFVDIDGTLITEDQMIPDSAIKAINLASKRNNDVFIATGRSISEIDKNFRKINFKGYICGSGTYIEINNQIHRNICFKKNQIDFLISYFSKINVEFYMETKNGVYLSENFLSTVEKLWFQRTSTILPLKFKLFLTKNKNKTVPKEAVNKVSFISENMDFNQIISHLKYDFEIYRNTVYQFGDYSGELAPKGHTKATAIDYIKTLYRGPIKTYAYGNGDNDVVMFQSVDHAVAIADSKDYVITHANEVTEKPENNGIYLSFKKNNII